MMNLLMFLLTLVSVIFAGGYFNQSEPLPSATAAGHWYVLQNRLAFRGEPDCDSSCA